jgi:hypothetical protein
MTAITFAILALANGVVLVGLAVTDAILRKEPSDTQVFFRVGCLAGYVFCTFAALVYAL